MITLRFMLTTSTWQHTGRMALSCPPQQALPLFLVGRRPIVSPELDLMIVTTICPHTLHARPFITGGHHPIRIVLKSELHGAMLTIDGQAGFSLQRMTRCWSPGPGRSQI